jgi:hypothetical protein
VLPFHKRSRMSSSIEIGTDELEAIELPAVRPPSVRPGAFRRSFASFSDDEMTVVRLDKRVSTSPPPRAAVVMPRIPQNLAPRFDDYAVREPAPPPRRRWADDEPTILRPSSRPLLAMSTPPRNVIVDEPPRAPRPRPQAYAYHEVPPPPSPASSRAVEDAPRSTAAVDASASSSHMRPIDMSMTASLSGSTDIRRMRGSNMGRALGLVAVGVFAGLVCAFAARGDGLSSIASLVDPSHVTADVANAVGAQPQAPVAVVALPGAAAPKAQPASKPAAPSCNAEAVAAPAAAKPEPKVERKIEVVKEAAPPV